MTHTLPQLPYAYNALEPFMSEQQLRIHHQNHHQTYVDKLNAALEAHKELQKKTPEQLIMDLGKTPEAIRTQVRNFGGGVANHTFFWNIMKKTDGTPSGQVAKAIDTQFGSFDAFKQQFSDSATKLFGSGWTWLVLEKGKLAIVNTPNQDSPISEGKTPLLVIDVWEHAYYLQYQYKRAEFIKAWFSIVDWQKVDANFKRGT